MKEKINILMYNSTLILGGTDVYMTNLAESIDKDKFNVDILIKSNKDCNFKLYNRLTDAGCNVYCGDGNVIKQMKYLIKFFKTHKNKYDLIHINASSNSHGLIAYFAQKYGNIKHVIFHAHMGGNKNSNSILKRFGQKLMLRYVTDFVSCSDSATANMFSKVKNKEILVFNNSINVDKLKFDYNIRISKRKELSLNEEFAILHIGRFDENKNQNRLLSIFKKYTDEYDDNSKLIFVGNGELEETIKTNAENLGIQKKVLFLGLRDDVDQILQAADMFIMPSFYEGLPISAVEAQASGLPTILSNSIISQTKIIPNVRFCSLKDSDEIWCKTIQELKTIYLEDIGKNRDTVSFIKQRKFDNESAIKDMEEYYERIIGENNDT